MKKYIIISILISISCKGQTEGNIYSENITTSDFELIKAENQKGLLILFPCFPCDAAHTLSEFEIVETSISNGFSVLAMNLNQRLFLSLEEKQGLVEKLTEIVQENDLSLENIYVGGFSTGGNVSLLITDYLINNKSKLQPKGIFIVDSPVDFLGLYKTVEKNLALNFSEPFIQESSFIKGFLDKEFGNPSEGTSKYENHSPYTFSTQNIDNLRGLEKLKIRFYIEPDLKWWMENTKNEYEDLNAFYIEKLADKLKSEFGSNTIEVIKTENQGYRMNGERHPHSWSIVDQKDLLIWILE